MKKYICVLLFPLLFLLLNPTMIFSQEKDTLIADKKDGKLGYVDAKGNVVIPHQFSSAGIFTKGYAVVGIENPERKHGLIDKTGKIIVPMEYNSVREPIHDFVIAEQIHTRDLYTTQGDKVYSCEYCRYSIDTALKRLYVGMERRSAEGETQYVLAFDGKKIFSVPGNAIMRLENNVPGSYSPSLRPRLPYYCVSSTGYDKVQNKNINYCSIIDLTGKVVMDSIEANWLSFTNSLLPVRKKGRAALVDTTFKELMPFAWGYEYFSLLKPDQTFGTSKNGKHGVITLKNEIIIPLIYDDPVRYFGYSNTYGVYNKKGDWLILSSSGDTIIPPGYYIKFDKTVDGTDYNKPVCLQDMKTYKYGYSDPRGGFSIPCVYDFLSTPKEGRIVFFKGDSAGYLNEKGEILFLANCERLSPFYEGIAVCGYSVKGDRTTHPNSQITYSKDGSFVGQFRYIDSTGTYISNESYDWVYQFREGYAQVMKGDEMYMIDRKGKKVVYEGKYLLASYFKDGYAVVTTNYKYFGIADSKGKIVVPVIYENIEQEEKGTISVTIYDRKTLKDEAHALGRIRYPLIKNKKIKAKKDGKWIELSL